MRIKNITYSETNIAVALYYFLVLNARLNVKKKSYTIPIKNVLNLKSFTKINQRTMKIE